MTNSPFSNLNRQIFDTAIQPEIMDSELIMDRKMTVYAYLAAYRMEDGTRPFLRSCGRIIGLANKGCNSKCYVSWAQVTYPIGQKPES